MTGRGTFKARAFKGYAWVTGYYVKERHGDCVLHWIYQTDGSRDVVIPETICQATGLVDMDGRMIYANDIIQGEVSVNAANMRFERGMVQWRRDRMGYCIVIFGDGGPDIRSLGALISEKTKVLGNHYDVLLPPKHLSEK